MSSIPPLELTLIDGRAPRDQTMPFVTVNEFLKRESEGVNFPYISMRTMSNGQVLFLEDHLQRLIHSFIKLYNDRNKFSETLLNSQLEKIVKAQIFPPCVRITLLWNYRLNILKGLVTELPKLTLDPETKIGCQVILLHPEIYSRGSDQDVKSTSWVFQRPKHMPPGVEEAILTAKQDDKDNKVFLLEGISSNILWRDMQNDNLLWTTNLDKVLQGTILKHAIQMMVIKEGMLPISDLLKGKIQAMAICSTSRLILPVSKVILYEDVYYVDDNRVQKPSKVIQMNFNDELIQGLQEKFKTHHLALV